MSCISKIIIEIKTTSTEETKNELEKLISAFPESEVEVTIPDSRTVLATVHYTPVIDDVLAIIEGI